METQRIKQTTQTTILRDRVKLEDIEKEKIIKKSSNKYENVKIGIIIPAYNEEKNIENVLKNNSQITILNKNKKNTHKNQQKFGGVLFDV